jgi:hypothetical protein
MSFLSTPIQSSYYNYHTGYLEDNTLTVNGNNTTVENIINNITNNTTTINTINNTLNNYTTNVQVDGNTDNTSTTYNNSNSVTFNNEFAQFNARYIYLNKDTFVNCIGKDGYDVMSKINNNSII